MNAALTLAGTRNRSAADGFISWRPSRGVSEGAEGFISWRPGRGVSEGAEGFISWRPSR